MSKIRLHGTSSGYTEIVPKAAAASNTLTAPSTVGELIAKDAAGAIGITSVQATNANFSGTTRITSGISTTLNITTSNITTLRATTGITTTAVINSATVGGVNVLNSDGVNTTGIVTAKTFVPTEGQLSHRRLNVNGAFTVSQKNEDTAVTGINGSSRWIDLIQNYSSSGGTFTCQRVTDAPTGYKYSAKYTVTTANSSLAAGDEDMFIHRIEGQDLAHLSWGSGSAKTITLSFWVKSSLTGDFSVTVQGGGGRCYVTAYTISSANTWEQKTVTIAGETSGTWVITNGSGLAMIWDLGAGSTYEASSADTWLSVANVYRKAGTVRFSGTNSATWQITGIQFEVGSVATPFEHLSYGEDLTKCQRYFWQATKVGNTAAVTNKGVCMMSYTSGSDIRGTIDFPVEMRTEPTLSSNDTSNSWYINAGSGADFFDRLDLYSATTKRAIVRNSAHVSGTAGAGGMVAQETGDSSLSFSAEL